MTPETARTLLSRLASDEEIAAASRASAAACADIRAQAQAVARVLCEAGAQMLSGIDLPPPTPRTERPMNHAPHLRLHLDSDTLQRITHPLTVASDWVDAAQWRALNLDAEAPAQWAPVVRAAMGSGLASDQLQALLQALRLVLNAARQCCADPGRFAPPHLRDQVQAEAGRVVSSVANTLTFLQYMRETMRAADEAPPAPPAPLERSPVTHCGLCGIEHTGSPLCPHCTTVLGDPGPATWAAMQAVMGHGRWVQCRTCGFGQHVSYAEAVVDEWHGRGCGCGVGELRVGLPASVPTDPEAFARLAAIAAAPPAPPAPCVLLPLQPRPAD